MMHFAKINSFFFLLLLLLPFMCLDHCRTTQNIRKPVFDVNLFFKQFGYLSVCCLEKGFTPKIGACFVLPVLCCPFCVARFVLPVLCCLFCVARFVLPVLCCPFCVACFVLPFVLPVLCCLFCVACFVLPVLCCPFCVACFVLPYSNQRSFHPWCFWVLFHNASSQLCFRFCQQPFPLNVI